MQQRSGVSRHINILEVDIAGDRARLAYDLSGPEEGFHVLLLHGWGSSRAIMRPMAGSLSDTYRVINVDLPGHGNSPAPASPWGVGEHVDAVRQLLDQLGVGSFALFAHSNGGRIALYLASESPPPPNLRKLILISPSGVRRRRTSVFYIRRGLAAVLKTPFHVLPKRAREFGLDWLRHSLVWKMLGSSDYRSLEDVMRDTFVKTVNCYLEDRLGLVRVPVLLLRGSRDDTVGDEQMQIIESSVPDAGLFTIDGAGHYAHLDRPDVVLTAAKHFLSEF